jgi:NADPH2:quinone reductase
VLEIVTEPAPSAGPGEVLIAVEALGVNFADVLMRQGRYRRDQTLPCVPGIEAAGTVVAAGEGVALAAGTRVAAFVEEGGYADRLVAPARQVVPLPAGVATEDAAGLYVQGITAWYAVHRYGRIADRETMVVHAGGGGVGGIAIQLGKAAGARVIATASTAEKGHVARERGADEAVLSDPETLAGRLRELTGRDGADVVIDGVGGPLFAPSFSTLARGGRYVVVGQSSGEPSDLDLRRLMPRGQTVSGFIIKNVLDAEPDEPGRAMRELLTLLRDGRLSLEVTTLPFERVADAHRMIEQRTHTGKLVLRP